MNSFRVAVSATSRNVFFGTPAAIFTSGGVGDGTIAGSAAIKAPALTIAAPVVR
jgi:hypothetical protein